MSNFRFISYLYEYKKEQKGRNTGFVRVRGLNDFIELNMQVKPAKGSYEIYVHYETLPEVKSILVGTIRAVNGECHGVFHNILPILRKEGLSFSAIEALSIWQEDVVCHGTDWSESKCLERFLNEHYRKQENPELIRASEKRIEEVEEEATETELVNDDAWGQEEEEETKQQKEIEDEAENHSMSQDVEQLIKEIVDGGEEAENEMFLELENESVKDSEETVKEEEVLTSEESKLAGKETLSVSGWPKPKTIEELMLQLKTIPSFGNDSFLKCVKIMPKDIGLLNSDDWYLGKNSFLLHGYFAYQYLMLGYIRFQDGGKQAVLGVPGVYNNKDKYLAELFGFTNFIQAKQQEIKTGTFGYWITSVHENI
ncbi:MAG: hypothetical protein IJA10_08895 [Lachnospiraceae bacterium]|nr:hypothetical protein [Lachnospiraceae bacterium]